MNLELTDSSSSLPRPRGGGFGPGRMANVKTRYGEVTRAAKEQHRSDAGRVSNSPEAHEEARLFAKFRDRAREDFRTLSKPVSRRD